MNFVADGLLTQKQLDNVEEYKAHLKEATITMYTDLCRLATDNVILGNLLTEFYNIYEEGGDYANLYNKARKIFLPKPVESTTEVE